MLQSQLVAPQRAAPRARLAPVQPAVGCRVQATRPATTPITRMRRASVGPPASPPAPCGLGWAALGAGAACPVLASAWAQPRAAVALAWVLPLRLRRGDRTPSPPRRP